MTKLITVAALAMALCGCTVVHVGEAAVDVAATAVSTTADVAGATVRTVTGSSSDDNKSGD